MKELKTRWLELTPDSQHNIIMRMVAPDSLTDYVRQFGEGVFDDLSSRDSELLRQLITELEKLEEELL
jgi:hypothetical protein